MGSIFHRTFLSQCGCLLAGHPGTLLPPTPKTDALTLEEIRDIVAHTRGFYARDFSLHLGWNNMRYIIDASLLQAELLGRTLVIPSSVYARTCEYHIESCADVAPMVDRANATGEAHFKELPVERRTGFRIPISVMLDLPRLRARHPVITISEYLRLHGLDPGLESSPGTWLQDSYHSQPTVFEPNNAKPPSLFVIENHWYEPSGTNRVDYIPEAMKRRGGWQRYSRLESAESGGHWSEEEPTTISDCLLNAVPEGKSVLDWDSAIDALKSLELGPDVDLYDDRILEGVLKANGWEVLYAFATPIYGLDKAIVRPIKQVARRSSIRGFKDDYFHINTTVIALRGQTHEMRGAGAMRFTEVLSRARFANMVVHDLKSPRRVLDLAGVLAARMRKINGGRQWMGAHIRRGDFVRAQWTLARSLEDHVEVVKARLHTGRSILRGLRHGNVTTYDIEIQGVEPNLEQVTVRPPLESDWFFVATDERDPEGRRLIRDAGGVFLSDLLTKNDKRDFGWPFMFSDVRALVEQSVLVHSGYFYGNLMSSFAGRVENMRAAHGVDRQTTLLD
ncbi:hypothetical protein BC826DRAFT_906218 [Russula brevipes]|nr:hypothetical protein BC826DRAFT_906218 [Russula brevipes]